MARILFVCTGNTCRSPLAERIARLHWPQHAWESAGVRPADGLHPLAAATLQRLGAETDGFASRQVLDLTLADFDAVVLIGAPAQGLDIPIGPRVQRWDVADPFDAEGSEAERLAVYAQTADELERRIAALAKTFD